ncbi:hypothetical protein B0H34DRAFT_736190 [Crassisporium funariophilum]|nr:hypothetical protein B0H34DRAFT_736190 [Crassisporium funariophilum]
MALLKEYPEGVAAVRFGLIARCFVLDLLAFFLSSLFSPFLSSLRLPSYFGGWLCWSCSLAFHWVSI